ncbi:MAG: hypothetical protein ACD_17C00448G0001 [uncultured bacterium]|nr:MAG: hypothetical protein ACD_17C00448G0001 [uncultured bacterium]
MMIIRNNPRLASRKTHSTLPYLSKSHCQKRYTHPFSYRQQHIEFSIRRSGIHALRKRNQLIGCMGHRADNNNNVGMTHRSIDYHLGQLQKTRCSLHTGTTKFHHQHFFPDPNQGYL